MKISLKKEQSEAFLTNKKYRLKKIFTFFFAVFYVVLFYAQNNIYYADFRTFYGEGIGRIHGVERNYSKGIRAGVGKKLNPETQNWARFFGADNVSLSFVYWDMSEMKYNGVPFGEVYGLSLSTELNLLKKNNLRFFLAPEIGVGFATVTVFTRPDSFVFGSHINALFGASLGAEIPMNKNWKLLPFFTLQHSSNGAFHLPNFGANAINLGVGIRKEFKNNEESQTSESKEIQLKKHGIELSAGIGSRGKYKQKGGFTKYGFYGGYSYFLNQMIGLRIGIDGVYFVKVYNPEEYSDSVTYLGESEKHLRLGSSAGIEFRFGVIALNANVGRYVYFKSPYDQKIYWNANLKYYVSPKFGFQGTLTSHKSQADFVNLGLFVRL